MKVLQTLFFFPSLVKETLLHGVREEEEEEEEVDVVTAALAGLGCHACKAALPPLLLLPPG